MGAKKSARPVKESSKQGHIERITILEAAFTHGEQAIFVVEPQQRTIITCNPAIEKIFGYTIAEVQGRSTEILYPTYELFQNFGIRAKAALDHVGISHVECNLLRKDGSVFAAEITTIPIQPTKDWSEGVISIVRDINSGKQAQQALQDSEALFRQTFEAIPNVAFLWERLENGDIILSKANHAADRMSQGKIFEFLGSSVENFLGQDPAAVARIKKAFRTGKPIRVEEGTTLRTIYQNAWVIADYVRVSDRYLLNIITDIAERKRAEAVLAETEAHLRAVLSNAPITIFALDDQGVFTLSEGKGLERVGLKPGENIGVSALELYASIPFVEYTGKKITGKEVLQRVLAGETVTAVDELRGVYFDNHIAPLRDANDKIVGVVGVATDITERKRAEAKSVRINRALRVISACNRELVTVKNEIDWLNELCRVIVEEGRFRMAWVGYADHDKGKHVRPVAHAGFEEGYLETVNITWADAKRGHGPTGTAIRTGQPVIARNIPTDPAFEPWRRAAIQRDYTSSIALPLIAGGTTLGALNVYATEADAFDAEEVELLLQLAWDLAYGIASLRTRLEKEQIQEALRESEAGYRSLFNNSLDGVMLTTPDGNILSANPSACQIFGRTEEEICQIGRNGILDVSDPRLSAALEERTRTGNFMGVLTHIRKDGTKFPAELSSAVFKDQDGHEKMSVIIRDITEQVTAKHALEHSLREIQRANQMLISLSKASERSLRFNSFKAVYATISEEISNLGYQTIILTLDKEADVLQIDYNNFEASLLKKVEKYTGLKVNGYRIPLKPEGVINTAISQKKPQLFTDFTQWLPEILPDYLHPMASNISQDMGLQNVIFAPLLTDSRIMGLMVVIGADLNKADVTIIEIFANQAAIALENADLFEQVQEGRKRMQALSNHLVEAQEIERQRIARDLHDEIGQQLTGLQLMLETSKRATPEELSVSLTESRKLIKALLNQVREMSLNLRPSMLDDLGLLPTLKWHLERYAQQTKIQVAFTHRGIEERRFPPKIETGIYRISQETLTNIARHASVKTARLYLWADENMFILQVEDQGVGFDVSQALSRQDSTGLFGIRERCELLGGRLTIESRPGKGTSITAEIPLSDQSLDRRRVTR
jgi:PAS domain S-box-containing protein